MHSLVQAEVDGIRLTEEEIIANCILTMIGGQETSTNLIGSGLLTLLRHPEQMRMLQDDPSLIPSGGRGVAAISKAPSSIRRAWRTKIFCWAVK